NRWADKHYKKQALGTAFKFSPFGGSSHAKGIVLEKMYVYYHLRVITAKEENAVDRVARTLGGINDTFNITQSIGRSERDVTAASRTFTS
ncbi:40S ribosomal protein S23, partial [Podila verticillata]